MSQVPLSPEVRPLVPVVGHNHSGSPEPVDVPLVQLSGIVRRHIWLIATVTVLTTAAALAYVLKTVPVYQGSTTLRIAEKQPDLPNVFLSMSPGDEVVTEVEVLRSRSLVEDATRHLNLQVVVLKPQRVSRQDLLSQLSVAEDAVPGKYVLRRLSNGRFALTSPLGTRALSGVTPGSLMRAGGLAFMPTPAAAGHAEIEIQVNPLERAVARVQAAVRVAQGNRVARVVRLSYRDTDPQLVWQVPNVMAERYIARRQDAHKATARSTVAFLRKQLDTLSHQLDASQRQLREFREREHVVNPQIEGSSQVDRLIRTQSERSTLEAERAALSALLSEVETSVAQLPAEQSPYRRLLAFPTLLRSAASNDLLRNLTEVEDRRSQLLIRRTPSDPEVQALDLRVREIEKQLHSVASTYLRGLTNQVRSVDTAIQAFGRQLSQVPRRELEFARLQRQPKVLEEMYSLLRTRLKEAEITQAVEDPSVQIVDRAVPPLAPVSPRKTLTVAAGLIFGLLLGVAIAFLLEYLDKAIHTRTDVSVATGLPVLGLIPRIPRSRNRIALISKRRELPADVKPNPSYRDRSRAPKASYTFLMDPKELESLRSASPDSVSAKPGAPHAVQRVDITCTGAAVAEAYGSLQTNLLYARPDHPVRTVVFTSAQPGEGKTTSVVNLALSLTYRCANVLLIDADLRRGTVHKVFHVPRAPGFADVLSGAVRLEDACRSVEVNDGGVLHYLTAGTLPPNPHALLSSHKLKSLFENLRNQYEMIIIDSPPVNMMTDAALLGSITDGVVIVARAGVTHSAALGYALEQLGHVRAQVLGVVLNDIDFKRDATYDAAYRYYVYGGQYTDSSR